MSCVVEEDVGTCLNSYKSCLVSSDHQSLSCSSVDPDGDGGGQGVGNPSISKRMGFENATLCRTHPGIGFAMKIFLGPPTTP